MSVLSSLLVQNKILGVTQIEQALQRQVIFGGNLTTNLLELGLIDEKLLLEYLGKVMNLSIISGANLLNTDPRVVKMLPWKFANEHKIVPIRMYGNALTIAVSDMITKGSLDEVSFLLDVEISINIALEFRMAMALNQFYGIAISGRFSALQAKLAPEFQENQPPIVPPLGDKTFVFSPASARGDVLADVHAARSTEKPVPIVESERSQSTETDFTLKFVTKKKENTFLNKKVNDNTARQIFTSAKQTSRFEPEAKIAKKPVPKKMISFSEASQKLNKLKKRDNILDLLFEFSSQAFDFTALFIVRGDGAVGRNITPSNDHQIPEREIFIPLDKDGMFEHVFTTHSLHLGPPGETSVDMASMQSMERGSPQNCAILPILLRGRVILILYGDSGDVGVRPKRVTRLVEFCRLISAAFERVLLQQKIEGHREEPASLTSKEEASEIEPALEDNLKEPNPTRVKMIVPADMHIKPSSTPEEDEAERPTMPMPEGSHLNASPDQELVKRVETLIVGPSPEMPFMNQTNDQHEEETTVVSESELKASAGNVELILKTPPQKAESKPLRLSEPPLEFDHIAKPSPVQTPSTPPFKADANVRTKIHEDMDRLIGRVISQGQFDKISAQQLVEMGDEAAAKLITFFPGPLNYDRYQESSRLKQVGQHGPVLQALLMFGDSVVPHILPLLNSFDSEIRFYSTFIFSEIGGPGVLPGLIKRVFDNDRQIRELAINIIKRFRSNSEYRSAVLEIALVLVGASSSLERRRMAAAMLGEIGDSSAIRSLVEMLGSVDGILAERCRKALVKITFSDFGFSERRWLTWWEVNKTKHRIEWAVAALNHRVEEIRVSAISDLKEMVGDGIDWPYGPLDHKQRRECKRHILQWWEREGRALNPIAEID